MMTMLNLRVFLKLLFRLIINILAMAKAIDPNAPKPTGSLITPNRGDFPSAANIQSPKTVDSILHRYGTTQPKAVAGMILDSFGKNTITLTYGLIINFFNL